jgi:hypothetical protein
MLQGKGLRVLRVDRLIRLESTESALPFRNRSAARSCEADSTLLKGLDTGRGPVGNVVLRFILSVILHQKPLPISNETGPTCFVRAPAPRDSHFPKKKTHASHGPASGRVRSHASCHVPLHLLASRCAPLHLTPHTVAPDPPSCHEHPAPCAAHPAHASRRPRPCLTPPASCLAPRAAHTSCCAPPCRVN